jgi:predicted Zn-dependent peptidase
MLINIFLKISISICFFCVIPCFAKSFEREKLPEGAKFIRKASIVKGTSPIYEFHFKNGLKLLVLSDSRNPMGYIKFILDAGSNREVKGKTGLAHFFEHMMLRKTKNEEEGHYDRFLSSLGGSGNAGTSNNFVMYYSKFPGPAIEKVLSIPSS